MNQRRTVGAKALLATAAVVLGSLPVARAQAPATPAPAPASAPAPAPTPGPAPAAQPAAAPAVNEVSDLTTRYRFIERYAATVAGGAAKLGEIDQYRVASRDVLRVVSENPQGTPDRKETTVQVIYTEKPLTVNSTGGVTAMIRHYDALRITPQPETKPSARKPLEGLTVWLQPKPGGLPKVIALTDNHPLTETEFTISAQRLVFLPDLTTVLPALPSRVGDRWAVPRSAQQAILGDRPTQQGKPLVAELVDVRKLPGRPEAVAVIRITGDVRLASNGSPTLINAQVLFRFATPPLPAATAEGDAASAPTTIDARGAIIDVRVARTSSAGMPGSNGRLRRTFTWELTLQRDLANTGAPLSVPPQIPAPNVANSWLTYDDPEGRFHFRHPQDMHPKVDPDPDSEDSLQLLDEYAGTLEGRVVTFVLQNKTGDPEKDRNIRDPEFHKRDLNEHWARNRRDVLHGPAGWLPDAEWAPYKMKVYRIEAAEKPVGASARERRIFLDHYLILFSQNESLAVDAITGQDPPIPFRKQVEEILKTFVLSPSTAPAG